MRKNSVGNTAISREPLIKFLEILDENTSGTGRIFERLISVQVWIRTWKKKVPNLLVFVIESSVLKVLAFYYKGLLEKVTMQRTQ